MSGKVGIGTSTPNTLIEITKLEYETKYEILFEVWIQGEIGIYAGKPIMYSIHKQKAEAQKKMRKFLEEGRYAAIKEIKILKAEYYNML
jgi:hypothetical protein|tara:strand:- start:7320 stop:7586 length:267 start_codon:yes stop_codon:yes gene_type:complete